MTSGTNLFPKCTVSVFLQTAIDGLFNNRTVIQSGPCSEIKKIVEGAFKRQNEQTKNSKYPTSCDLKIYKQNAPQTITKWLQGTVPYKETTESAPVSGSFSHPGENSDNLQNEIIEFVQCVQNILEPKTDRLDTSWCTNHSRFK